MEQSKFEQHLIQTLEDRQLSVAHLTDRLDAQLTLQKKRQNKAAVFRAAGLILLLLGISGISLSTNPTFEPQMVVIGTEVFPLDNSNGAVEENNERLLLEDDGLQDSQMTSAFQRPIQKAIQLNSYKVRLPIIKPNPNREKLVLQKQPLYIALDSLETELLLAAALESLSLKNKKENQLPIEVRAMALLEAVEVELENEATLKHRVYEVLKTGYSGLKYVLIEKDNE